MEWQCFIKYHSTVRYKGRRDAEKADDGALQESKAQSEIGKNGERYLRFVEVRPSAPKPKNTRRNSLDSLAIKLGRPSYDVLPGASISEGRSAQSHNTTSEVEQPAYIKESALTHKQNVRRNHSSVKPTEENETV